MSRRKETPTETQKRISRATGYGPIHLHRSNGVSTVSVLIGELWIPVIRDCTGEDGTCDDTTYPLGQEENIAGFFSEREPLFEFSSHTNWVQMAQQYFSDAGHNGDDTVCIDRAGRLIDSGFGFERAQKDKTFPVVVYSTREDVSE